MTSMWLTDLNLVDTSTGAVDAYSIEIKDGLIAQLVVGAPEANATSLGGAYVLPGLICCHTHLQGIWPHSLRDENELPSKTALRAAWQARRTLGAGVTTVRCLHEQSAVDVVLRDAIRDGLADGPGIFASGRGLTVPGGHGDGFGCRLAQGKEGFFRGGLEELKGGADQLKVYASGGLARAGESLDQPEMTLEEMRGAVEAADEYSTYVVAHASSSPVVRQGVEAGIRSFEHAYQLDTSTAEMMADSGAFLTPTLVVSHSQGWMIERGFNSAAIERSKTVGPRHLESAATAHQAGVRIVVGTDFAPTALDDGVSLMIREMELLVEAGLKPLEAIQAATVTAAELLGSPELGRVAVGGPADLIVVAANPIDNIAALERIQTVIKSGAIVPLDSNRARPSDETVVGRHRRPGDDSDRSPVR